MKYVSCQLIFIIFLLGFYPFGDAYTKFTNLNTNTDKNNVYLKFGVNYLSTHWHYDSFYLSDEELHRDFKLFSDRGVEFITIAVVWTYFEQIMGVYNNLAFNDLRRICEIAKEYELQVIIDFHTLMFNNSWTMPEWLSPRRFQTVLINSTVRNAWLNFLAKTVSTLDDINNIHSWHMMNEPAIGDWACDVTVDEFISLWSDMRETIKAHSEKPISIRFAAQVYDSHFNRDSRIYELCDYISLNWYEEDLPDIMLLKNIISEVNTNSRVVISEFGLETPDDELQRSKYQDYIALFRSSDVSICSAWFWRSDYEKGPPNGMNFNLTMDLGKKLRPAFFEMNLVGDKPIIYTTNSSESSWSFPIFDFNFNDTVYVRGEGFRVNKEYRISLVEDKDWSNGNSIPKRIVGTMDIVRSNWEGKLNIKIGNNWGNQIIWGSPLTDGEYDIIMDLDNDGVFNEGVDIIYDGNVGETSGFVVGISKVYAKFVNTPSPSQANEIILFDASESYDPYGTINYYEWNFGDAIIKVSNSSKIQHVFSKPGIYTVSLKVKGNSEKSGVYQQQVQIDKINGGISLITSKSDLKTGENLSITGLISPPLQGVKVTITIYGSSGSQNHTTFTDSIGNYVYNWKPNQEGNYQISSAWSGDEIVTETSSQKSLIRVSSRDENRFDLYLLLVILLIIITIFIIKFSRGRI